MTREEEIKLLTTPLPEHNYIEAKDFARLEREGKLKKGELYIVHGSVEDMEKLRRKGMTREECIEMLQILLDNAKVGCADITVIHHVSSDSFKFVIEQVIEALKQEQKTDTWSIKDVADTLEKHGLIAEQEPCEDAVSRQALDEIKELMTDINGDTVYATRMSDIRQLPSVNPICEEREKGECPYYAGY